VWATSGASRSDAVGAADGCVRVRVAAPAREGRANAELTRFIAVTLGVRGADVTLARGASGRRKLVRVRGVEPAEARDRLGL
jgi:uncharacterized protein